MTGGRVRGSKKALTRFNRKETSASATPLASSPAMPPNHHVLLGRTPSSEPMELARIGPVLHEHDYAESSTVFQTQDRVSPPSTVHSRTLERFLKALASRRYRTLKECFKKLVQRDEVRLLSNLHVKALLELDQVELGLSSEDVAEQKETLWQLWKRPDTSSFTKETCLMFLEAFARAGESIGLDEVLEVMENSGYATESQKAQQWVMLSLACDGMIDQARLLYDVYKSEGDHDSSFANTYLLGLCRHGDEARILRFFLEMQTIGPPVVRTTLVHVLEYYATKGKVAEMEHLFQSHAHSNTATGIYNTMLKGFIRAQDFEAAKKWVVQMRCDGTYNARTAEHELEIAAWEADAVTAWTAYLYLLQKGVVLKDTFSINLAKATGSLAQPGSYKFLDTLFKTVDIRTTEPNLLRLAEGYRDVGDKRSAENLWEFYKSPDHTRLYAFVLRTYLADGDLDSVLRAATTSWFTLHHADRNPIIAAFEAAGSPWWQTLRRSSVGLRRTCHAEPHDFTSDDMDYQTAGLLRLTTPILSNEGRPLQGDTWIEATADGLATWIMGHLYLWGHNHTESWEFVGAFSSRPKNFDLISQVSLR
ncbi:hypothetical protein DFJ77DRAFT_541641 [Powellomyces hirtus]|nr:hypothetical protein DFJ77DRAFT_541641 [Powellomyces hirtus]